MKKIGEEDQWCWGQTIIIKANNATVCWEDFIERYDKKFLPERKVSPIQFPSIFSVLLPKFFSVAKATLQPPMSDKDVVILNQGCGYIQKDVVI